MTRWWAKTLRRLINEAIEEAVPAKIREFIGGEEVNYGGLLNWINTSFPVGLSAERANLESRNVDENIEFLVNTIQSAYELKSSHEEAEAVKGLERYIVLNAVDRLLARAPFRNGCPSRGIQLQRIGQKDPLVEYKNEAYSMFVELMGILSWRSSKISSAAHPIFKRLRTFWRACHMRIYTTYKRVRGLEC